MRSSNGFSTIRWPGGFKIVWNPQNEIEIVGFRLPFGKRSLRSLDVNVDRWRRPRDALDKRWDDEKIHIIGRRDDKAPRACRHQDELFSGADQIPYVAQENFDRANQGECSFRRFMPDGVLTSSGSAVQLLAQPLQNVAHC